MVQLASESMKGIYNGWSAEKLPIIFRPGDNFLYHGQLQDEQGKS